MLHDTTDKHFTYSVELLLSCRFTAHDLFYITLLRQSYDVIILYNSAACYMTQQTNISLILQSYCSAVDLLHTIFLYITLLRQSYDVIILYNSAACYMTQQTNISLILQRVIYCSHWYSYDLLQHVTHISLFQSYCSAYHTILRQSYDVIILYNSAACYMT